MHNYYQIAVTEYICYLNDEIRLPGIPINNAYLSVFSASDQESSVATDDGLCTGWPDSLHVIIARRPRVGHIFIDQKTPAPTYSATMQKIHK